MHTEAHAAYVSRDVDARERVTISHAGRPDGGVSIRFRPDSADTQGRHTEQTHTAAASVQSRLDHLRSLLSDTREQLHESSIALSPALGIPDVDDTDMDTTRSLSLSLSLALALTLTLSLSLALSPSLSLFLNQAW